MMLMFCTLLFLSLNGHLVTLDLLVQSFRQWPVGSSIYRLELQGVITLFGWSMAAALALALPAVWWPCCWSIWTFGVMNRTSPSLNIISLGFPMTLLLGLVALSLSVSGVPSRYLQLVEHCFTALHGIVAP